MNCFETWNPATNEKLNDYKYISDKEIQSKIEKLDTSFAIWKNFSIEQRITWLESLKNNLKLNLPELARIITQTMGKPLIESKLEIEKCIGQFDYYIEKGPVLLQEQVLTAHYPEMKLHFLPMGTIFSVMPWNFPAWQFFRFAVGAWLAGNVVLLKHSEITTEVGLLLEKLAGETQGPNILQLVVMDPNQSETVFSHRAIRAVTFTGSTRVGRKIGEMSGRFLKKSVLELGGSDAFIVDTSADIEKAAKLAVAGRLLNNGQSCIASKRFFVPKNKSHEFMNLVNKEIKNYVVGDPMERTTKLGPLAHKKFFKEYQENVAYLEKVASQSTDTMKIPGSNGYYVSPYFFLFDGAMIEGDVDYYRFFQSQELFSPIGMVIPYENERHWQRLVNDGPYGLGAVWIGDREKFKNEKLHLKFDVGMIAVNDTLRSDARVPFGGVKESGFGRESGEFGIREFCNTQSLGIK